ncbi:bifunctional DNA-formamidopyrimidine glycosylase/DNA-(apurinic or apyrimidinic site) lyase [uncultured Veillonella sp.]|uniref:bifunctional DNA-formamidopyrimidine glycosylase/DNA-(apurinic or apyrimidinic site) lyase n=1 Tax=uncultured Veillonella sp. TaxID=159268 RepID=UPI0025F6CBBA|nr:bifunctional DNA-formamidopyrimidine glycosylase/DNA-(apurinic or apyrimidinic site) lyase [uncultured Veillonella sp.]MDY3973354.1 bifunctional DNA-formamidopyrimidine glycosylase/DNA-(apurinic or apyrimidinic site) lyase [Veillonella caviae]
MPELPEVEIIREYIDGKIRGKTIDSVETLLPRLWRNSTPAMAHSTLKGLVVAGLKRRGKYLILHFEEVDLRLVIHLKLTGRLVYHESSVVNRFDRILFHFTDGSELAYGDVRTLGGLYLFLNEEVIDLKSYVTMGVEPLREDFTPAYMYEVSRRSGIPIKPFLLDQKYVAGIGNIYADEALFKARIRPTRRANSLTKKESKALCEAIKEVLLSSLSHGGTSFRDYKNGAGEKGDNQNYLSVYGRGGQPCKECGAPLSDMTLRGRHTVYCKYCQK